MILQNCTPLLSEGTGNGMVVSDPCRLMEAV